MKKRGQFFLIAAVVIIVIIVGLGVVYNSVSSSREEVAIYELSDEISAEASQIVDSGVFNSLEQVQINENIESLAKLYAASKTDADEILFIYGDRSQIHVLNWTKIDAGSVGIGVGGDEIGELILNKESSSGTITPSGNKAEIRLSPKLTQEFEITSGQNFYIILKRNVGADTYVSPP